MNASARPLKYANKLGNPKVVLDALEITQSKHGAADFLRRLNMAFQDEEYKKQFFGVVSIDRLVSWLENSPSTNELFDILYSVELMPTPEILSFAEQEGKEGLEQRIQEIKEGGFDLSNQLHVELEYSKYKMNGLPKAVESEWKYQNLSLENFSELPWIENKNIVLNKEDHKRIKSTAKETLNVFNLIKEKQQEEIPTLVIGNERYGDMFVVEPIKKYLENIGVEVTRMHVSSFNYDTQSRFDTPSKISEEVPRIPHKILEYIIKNKPNIFVVDSTKQSKCENGATRFPAAIQGYINAFENLDELNDYEIELWSPKLTEKVFIGEYEYKSQSTGNKDRKVTMISSASMKGSGADFDDPEEYAKNYRLGFTSKGLGCSQVSKDTHMFVKLIQEYMKMEIKKRLD